MKRFSAHKDSPSEPNMSFEIKERDLLARIGRLRTKSGIVETPALLPVVNPAVQPIQPKAMGDELNCKAIIVNAYLIKRRLGEEAIRTGIHKLLDFDGVIMTDSGAYQILVYGEVETSPEEIVRYQEDIGSDIATILDVPTGWEASEDYARWTVEETLRRARALANVKTREGILWVGPVQGGRYIGLVEESARRMKELPFDIYALGSPTPVMEQYLFDLLVDMIAAAKANLPLDKPLHLFGAGHPLTFALAIALGCDLFDSAAYAIYAREGRYMTECGTIKLDRLKHLPCSCPVCAKDDLKNLLDMPKDERERQLARHNLYVCFAELKKVKQSIGEGRLWEHLTLRAYGHPALLTALKKLERYKDLLEKQAPVTKRGGLFFYGYVDLIRPEVVRHRRRLLERYSPPEGTILLLLPQAKTKPFHESEEVRAFFKALRQELGEKAEEIHVCTYAAPFGVVPTELDDVYPLSQHEVAMPLDAEMVEHVANCIAEYIRTKGYKRVILLNDVETWRGRVKVACRLACEEKGIPFDALEVKSYGRRWNEGTLRSSIALIKNALLGIPSA